MVKSRKEYSRAHHGPADVIVGKKGVTSQVVDEIKRRLEKKGVLKIRLLKTAIEVEGQDRRQLARKIAELAGAELVGVRGRTLVIAKRRGSTRKRATGDPSHLGY